MDKLNSKLNTAGDKNQCVGFREVQRHCQNAAWMHKEGEDGGKKSNIKELWWPKKGKITQDNRSQNNSYPSGDCRGGG